MQQSKLIEQVGYKKIWGKVPETHWCINTDSRKFNSGEVFVALKGENFDAFNFLGDIVQKNPSVVVFDTNGERELYIEGLVLNHPNICFIGVDDSLVFLQRLATEHVQRWRKSGTQKKRIIGITGSNGKTTHKEMVTGLLKAIEGKAVLATKGNLNNHIGVPLTVLNLTSEHNVGVIEMGMNHPGEIAFLCDIADPDCGLITSIGSAHIEFMGSVEAIFKEKSSLYHYVQKKTNGQGEFVVNADDEYLNKISSAPGVISFGEKGGHNLVSIQGSQISLVLHNKKLLITNKNIQEHYNLKNLVCAFMLVSSLYPNQLDLLVQAAEQFSLPSNNRSQWIDDQGRKIFLDAYNANPSSMKTSLESFFTFLSENNVSANEALFVLGDMNELGDFAPKYHREIGEYLKQMGALHVVFIGRFHAFYKEGYGSEGIYFNKKDDFQSEWVEKRKNHRFIFIKASRSLQLESLIDIK